MITIHHGDCLDVMRGMADASVDSVVTDPPYGLGFMGKKWDTPGSFVERKAETRNTFDHVGGNHNPTCSADAARTRAVEGRKFQRFCDGWAAECFRLLKPGGYLVAFSSTRTYHRMGCAIEDAGFEIRDQLAWLYGSGFPKSHNLPGGFGTALKPAHEPVCLARKPLIGTVAANVAAHGTGALNIDKCRVEGEPTGERRNNVSLGSASGGIYGTAGAFVSSGHTAGRWPANVCHDGSDEVLEAFARFGERTSGKMKPTHTTAGRSIYGQDAAGGFTTMETYGDTGTAARFFYTAKADSTERHLGHIAGERNGHPTVKPIDLMQWLCRLITPPGGTVLDPFAGSGSTGIAADREQLNAILIEREAEYVEIMRRRIYGDAPLLADIA